MRTLTPPARPPLVVVCARPACIRPATRTQPWGFIGASLAKEAVCWRHFNWPQAARIWLSARYWRIRHRRR